MTSTANQADLGKNPESPIVVVTGSSSGIGRAIALEMARHGWQVVLHGRSVSDRLLAVQQDIKTLGGTSYLHPFDFASEQSLNLFVDQVFNQAGVVDAWINNAGGDVLTGDRVSDSFEDKLAYLLKVDVAATLILSRDVGLRMKQQANTSAIPTKERAEESPLQSGSLARRSNGRFSIINIGWDQAAIGMAGESGEMFATTKGAIMAMTRSLAQSLAPQVRVNCIAPGWIKTQWGDGASQYWTDRAQRESLMNRWGYPEDIAGLTHFLCSPSASYISGQVIPVNGGFRFSQH